eukprot:TRINITY_DN7838_c0_g3_i2.p1 TRINITY_DN7838_c0_g3~~TRINITY_DN7838_c0_g3_i2.p1  ORF type:complete len:228 (+),score=54.62 TRINITY_DN7838_c0_g3_i2:73-756(+)
MCIRDRYNILPMGQCCSRNMPQRYEGVDAMNVCLGPSYAKTKRLDDGDVNAIMTRILYDEYGAKLYQKLSLQAQRSKELKSGMTERYVALLAKTKTLEENTMKESTNKALKFFKIDEQTFQTGKDSVNEKNLIEVITNSLMLDIQRIKKKLSMDKEMIEDLRTQHTIMRAECKEKLKKNPQLAGKMKELYGDEGYVTCLDVMIADCLYPKFGLLPIEVLAFTQPASQ